MSTKRKFKIGLIVASLLLLAACGGSSKSSSGMPQPQPQPGPGPGPGPGSSPQFTESMLSPTGAVAGQVVIAQNGSGMMTIMGAPASTSFSIEFCPFAQPSPSCNSVGSTTSSAMGGISAAFTMSSGGFAGIFQVVGGSNSAFTSAFNIPAAGSMLQAPLIRASTVNAGFGSLTNTGFGVGFDPLTSGSVTLGTGTSVHVTLAGAAANASYGLTWCRNNTGSSCFAIGGLMTDASGNFSGDFDLSVNLGMGMGEAGAFLIASNKPPAIQFVQGFTVP